MASEGEYLAELLTTNGDRFAHYQDVDQMYTEIKNECYTELNKYLNDQRKHGWIVDKIEKPDIKIDKPRNSTENWYFRSETFILFKRKPMAEAIYGE